MSKYFKLNKPHYRYLESKWKAKHKKSQQKLWEKHKESLNFIAKKISPTQLVASSLSGLLLLTTPSALALPTPEPTFSKEHLMEGYDRNIFLLLALKEVVPSEVRSLTYDEEQRITSILSGYLGFKVTSEINGIRLNRNYGYIGGEQHLYRYPGDNLYNHTENATEWAMFGSAGIAPKLAAWGYFAPSKEEFRQKDKLREKYYLAIQTFLAPGFSENVSEFRDFFKFRKMLVINTLTGQAVVGVIGDAGPADWTGKHLGGSPEIMHELGLSGGSRNGAVLYFFIDDPEDRIPLGPIKIVNKES